MIRENVFSDTIERKNAFEGYKNKKFKEVEKLRFLMSMVLVQNWPFFDLFFWGGGNIGHGVSPWFWYKFGHFPIFFILGKMIRENVFSDTIERKNAFEGYKNKKFKEVEKLRFLMSMVLVQNWPFSYLFFILGNIGQENVFMVL